MAPRPSPDVRRRRLSLQLKALRVADGRTATQVAKLLGWPTSRLTRIERNEWKLPASTDVTRLADVYGVAEQVRAMLLQLVRDARQKPWWRIYDLPEQHAKFVAMEHEARVLRVWETSRIPALLQTAAYAAAHLAALAPDLPEQTARDILKVHSERKRLLLHDPDDPVHLHAILDEAALQRGAGTDLMRAQMEHLLKLSELPRMKLQVVRFSCGMLPAMGSFTIITYPVPADPETAYVYRPTSAVGDWVDEPADLAGLEQGFERLVAAGEPYAATKRFIRALA